MPKRALVVNYWLMDDPAQPKPSQILAAMLDFRDAVSSGFIDVNARLDRVESRLERVESRLDRVDSRLDRVERHLSRLDDGVSAIEFRLTGLERRLK